MFDVNFPDFSGWFSSHKPEVITGLAIAGIVYVLTKSKFLSVIVGAISILLGVSLL